MKTFKIADNRLLKIAKKYDQLCIEEKGSAKSATFTPSRWASFLLCLDEINSQVEKLVAGENIAYRCHYGASSTVTTIGNVFSVTSGFNCVDLRQFYQPFGKTEWKSTKTGIGLRLSEWETFKNVVVNLVQRNHPAVANFTPCFLNEDHTTVEGMQSCRECNPYASLLN